MSTQALLTAKAPLLEKYPRLPLSFWVTYSEYLAKRAPE